MHLPKIQQILQASIDVKQELLKDQARLQTIDQVVQVFIKAFEHQKKVLFCGNGGSAADAQHIAAELSGRFYKDRPPLFAEALHVNSSYLTAVANDYGYEEVYARIVRAMGQSGDVLVAISTSGNSPNVVKAVHVAKELGMTIIGMTGQKGGLLRTLSHHLINIPSNDTPRIQEAHITVGHIICELVELELFG